MLIGESCCWGHVYIAAGVREVVYTAIGGQDAQDLPVHALFGVVLGTAPLPIQEGQVTTILEGREGRREEREREERERGERRGRGERGEREEREREERERERERELF